MRKDVIIAAIIIAIGIALSGGIYTPFSANVSLNRFTGSRCNYVPMLSCD